MAKPWAVVLARILAGVNQSERDGLKNDLVEVKKKKKKQLCVELCDSKNWILMIDFNSHSISRGRYYDHPYKGEKNGSKGGMLIYPNQTVLGKTGRD